MFKRKSKIRNLAIAAMLALTGTAYAATQYLSTQETMSILENASYDDDGYYYYRINSIGSAASYLRRRTVTDEDGNEYEIHANINPIFQDASTQGMLNLIASEEEYAKTYASEGDWRTMFKGATFYNVSASNGMTRQQLLDRLATDIGKQYCKANSIQSASLCLTKDIYEWQGGVAAFYSTNFSIQEGAMAYLKLQYPTFFNTFATAEEKAVAERGLKSNSEEFILKNFGRVWSQADYNKVYNEQAPQDSVGQDPNTLDKPGDNFTQLGQQDDETSQTGTNQINATQQGAKAISTIEQAVNNNTAQKPTSMFEAAQIAIKNGGGDSALEAYSKTGDKELLSYIATKYSDLFMKYASQDEMMTVATTTIDTNKVEQKITDYSAGKSVSFKNQNGTDVNIKTDNPKPQNNTGTTNNSGAQVQNQTGTEGNPSSSGAGGAVAVVAGAAAGGLAAVVGGNGNSSTNTSTPTNSTSKKKEDDYVEVGSGTGQTVIPDVTADAIAKAEQYMNNYSSGGTSSSSSSSSAFSSGISTGSVIQDMYDEATQDGEKTDEEKEKEKKEEEQKKKVEITAHTKKVMQNVYKAMENGVLHNHPGFK